MSTSDAFIHYFLPFIKFQIRKSPKEVWKSSISFRPVPDSSPQNPGEPQSKDEGVHVLCQPALVFTKLVLNSRREGSSQRRAPGLTGLILGEGGRSPCRSDLQRLRLEIPSRRSWPPSEGLAQSRLVWHAQKPLFLDACPQTASRHCRRGLKSADYEGTETQAVSTGSRYDLQNHRHRLAEGVRSELLTASNSFSLSQLPTESLPCECGLSEHGAFDEHIVIIHRAFSICLTVHLVSYIRYLTFNNGTR